MAKKRTHKKQFLSNCNAKWDKSSSFAEILAVLGRVHGRAG